MYYTMGARFTPKTIANMRNPVFRATVGAIVLFFFFAMMMRSDTPNTHDILKSNGVEPVDPKLTNNNRVTPGSNTDSDYEPVYNHQMNCDLDMPHLQEVAEKYNISNKFQYMKRYVRFTRTEGLPRKRMTKLDQNLLPGKLRTVELGREYEKPVCAEPLEVEVPKSGYPATVNASDFMFGVSTTYARFMDPTTTPINEWMYWLTDSHGHTNGGKLLLMLLDGTDAQLQEVANVLGDVGIDVDVYHSDSSFPMAVRYLTLVPTLYTQREALTKKWLVTCDDDTFFPSMHALVDKFKEFDHTMPMYIGTLSEDVGAIDRHGSQAFGGAGVFLSLPMAEKITDLYEYCKTEKRILESDSGWGPQGDILLRKCVYENTEVRLTSIHELWQLDILGHPSGFYEWGIKPLSLHHYRGRGWHSAKPGQFSKIAQTCGEDCVMQRFQTTDDFIISGYSIAHYPEGITFDTNQIEGTMYAAPENKGWNLDFVFGPARPSLLKTGRKIAWELQESEVRADGSVLQTYTRRKNDWRWVYPDTTPMSSIDGIIELVWIPGSSSEMDKDKRP